MRLFLDEGAPMLALLHDALARAPRTGSLEYDALRPALPLLSAAGPGGLRRQDPPSAGALADPLSDRELEVLRLLDSELTGPEIARQLYVSVNTLRTHTKRIFTKLDVNTRAAAVRRGHELGLL